MNTLTDILGLNNRNRYTKVAKDNDMIIVGTVQAPTIEGIAGPIPPHDIKLIRVIDLLKSDECVNQNVPTDQTVYAGVFRDRTSDPLSGECYINFRRFKSLSLNLTITENGDFIDFDCTAEANTASNLGTGAEVFKSKVGEDLQFRTLKSSDLSISITQDTNEIDFTVPSGKLSIANANGVKTFYATLAAAMTAASTGDTITFETDVEDISGASVTLKDGVDINLNSYTYKFNDDSAVNALIDNGVAAKCNIYDGFIERIGNSSQGTKTTALALYITSDSSEINFRNSVTIKSTNGYAISFKGKVYNGDFSGTAGSVVMDGAAFIYNSVSIASTGKAIENEATVTSMYVEGCKGSSVDAEGISLTAPGAGTFIIKNSIGTSNDAAGILLTGVSAGRIEAYDITGETNGDAGISCTYSIVLGAQGYSNEGTGIQLGNGHYTDCHGYSYSGSGTDFTADTTSNATFVNCTGVVDTGGHGGVLNSGTSCNMTLQNCDFTNNQDSASAHALSITNTGTVTILGGTYNVFSSAANCLFSASGGAISVSFADCVFKTGIAGTPVDPLITNTAISISNASTSSGLFIGEMKIDGATTITGNTQIDGQAYTPTATITDPGSGAVAIDFNNSNVQKITLTASAAYTLSNPTNLKEGGTYMIVVSQPAVTGAATVAYDTNYLFEGGTAPTITATAGAIDLLAFLCIDDGGTLKLVGTCTQNYS